jgi:CRP-like cAMP-binding protein/signal transduction histidine kinase
VETEIGKIEKYLKKAVLFQELTHAQISTIAQIAKQEVIPSKKKIIVMGEPGKAFYYLVEGSVDVFTVKRDGSDKHLATLKEGEVFGEMSLLTGEKCSATVISKAKSKVISIDKENFDNLLQKHSNLYNYFTQVLCRRLEHMTRGLEELVEQRTVELESTNKSLNEIMTNIHQAIFTIDKEYVLNAEFSARTKEIFGEHVRAGDRFTALINADQGESESWEKWLSIAFTNMSMSWEDIFYLAPSSKLEYTEPSEGEEKILELNILPIDVWEHKELIRKSLMVITTDITSETKLKEQVGNQQKRSMMLISILQNRRIFENFYNESMSGVETAKKILNSKKISIEDIHEVFRTVHSMKSSAGSLNIYPVVELTHEFESELSGYKKDGGIPDAPSVLKKFSHIGNALMAVRKELNDFTGPEVDVKRKRIEEWEIEKIKSSVNLDEAIKVIDSLDNPSLYGYMVSKSKSVFNKTLEKVEKQAELKLDIERRRISQDILSVLEVVLPHIINNALDHGVELPDERKAAGKKATADISLSAKTSDDGKHLVIVLKDDGKGIDLETVAAAAIEKGIVTEKDISLMSESEKLNLIFLQGVSSAEKVTEISGRGVVIDAVKRRIERADGRITVDTVSEKSTTFTITLPLF